MAGSVRLKCLPPMLSTGKASVKSPGWRHSAESRHARGYGTAWDKLRKLVLARDCGLCQCDECKRLGVVKLATEVDHRVPKSKGGTDDPLNLQAIAPDCHKRKTLADEGKRLRPVTGADGWPVD